MAAIGETLLPYQRRWFLDSSPARIALKARQTGFSTVISLEAVFGALNGRDQLIVSAAEKNAQEVLVKAKRWIDYIRQSGTKIDAQTDSKLEIGFKRGKILSLAQNPNTVRGFSGDVYLDEFAHHANAEEIYTAVYPTTTKGYRISVISTPLGQSGKFYDLYSKSEYNFSRHRVTLEKAVSEGLLLRGERESDEQYLYRCANFIDRIKSQFDTDSYAQEYCCEFVDEATAWMPYELIRKCIGESFRGDTYIGIDVGRKKDYTIICIASESNGRVSARFEELRGERFEDQIESIRRVLQESKMLRGRIDATGLGMQMSEELESDGIEGISFTNTNKQEMAVLIKRRFEEQSITIPDDLNLINDLHSIRREVTSSNNIRFDAERTSNGHGDRFWALGLALSAIESGAYGFIPMEENNA